MTNAKGPSRGRRRQPIERVDGGENVDDLVDQRRRGAARPQPPDFPRRLAETYIASFPSADIDSLEANLAIGGSGVALISGLARHIAVAGFDLSRPRFTLLRLLYLSPEKRLAQSEIAQELAVTPANVTQLIDALERDGWVERIVSSSDKRVTYAQLTAEGKKRCARMLPAMIEFMEKSVSVLSPREKAQLIRLLTKVRLKLQEIYSQETT